MRKTALNPAFDDLDGELTYLLIRGTAPRVVVEISPCGGWSSSWILHGLHDNNLGQLQSFDVIADSMKVIPHELQVPHWVFHQGDVRQATGSIPDDIDYLLLDSKHTTSFAVWYINNVIPRVRSGGVVCIDDMMDSSGRFDARSGESQAVGRWLCEHGIPYVTLCDGSPLQSKVLVARNGCGIGDFIHSSRLNPAVFFLRP